MSTTTDESVSSEAGGFDEFARRHFPLNVSMLITENAGFSIAIAFVGLTTVMPTFVTRLGGSAVLVGCIGACQTAGTLLTQVVGAGLCAGKPRMRPYLLTPLYIGRPAFVLVGLLIFLVGTRANAFLLAFFFVALFVFFATDGISSVPWYELIGKTVPPTRRGRMFGAAQIGGGLGGMAVGWIVGIILGNPSLRFPGTYGLLFLLAGGTFILNVIPFLLMKEPVHPGAAGAPPVIFSARRFVDSLGEILKRDTNFVRLVAARLLYGIGIAVFPFYVLFMEGTVAHGPARLGIFTSAQVFGTFVGGLSVGWMADRIGTRSVVRLAEGVGIVVPALALLLLAIHRPGGVHLLGLSIAIFILIGITSSANLIGFSNYVLESAPLEQRSSYIGLFNAFAGTLLVASPLAGWLLERTSFTVVFAVALAASLIGLGATAGLRAPSR